MVSIRIVKQHPVNHEVVGPIGTLICNGIKIGSDVLISVVNGVRSVQAGQGTMVLTLTLITTS
jgi:hypothetical protein